MCMRFCQLYISLQVQCKVGNCIYLLGYKQNFISAKWVFESKEKICFGKFFFLLFSLFITKVLFCSVVKFSFMCHGHGKASSDISASVILGVTPMSILHPLTSFMKNVLTDYKQYSISFKEYVLMFLTLGHIIHGWFMSMYGKNHYNIVK